MIIESIIDIFFIPLQLLLNMLPSSIVELIPDFTLPDIALMGAYFFPMDVIVFAISSWAAWYMIFMTWAIIEWVYKKIPGIN